MNATADKHDYERKDVDVRALFTVAFLLLLSCVAIFIVVALMMHYFKVHEPAVTAGRANIPVTRAREFPQPRLLIKPGASLAELRAAEDSDLNSYGWVDHASEIARIPIDRAMQLLLERGLPDVGAGQTPLSLMQGAPVGNGQPAASPNAERAMKIFLSCRAKSRHPDALSRVTLRDGKPSRADSARCVAASTSLGMTVILIFAFAASVFALTPGDLSRVTLEQHPGLHLSHDLVFRDENGQQFRFGNSTAKQPTVLVPGYYRCPMLCPLINDGLIQALQELRLTVGPDFQVVDFSIDPGDTPADAARKKSEYLRRYGRSGASDGWHCVVGDQRSIAQLADEIGFRYAYDAETKQYAHPSGVIVLTPDGKISRYIFGATFDARELRNALVAAREGESTSTLSKLFLLCYHYNPITGKYGALIMSIVRVAGVVTLLVITGFVALMVGRDRRARRALYETTPSPDGPAVRPYQ